MLSRDHSDSPESSCLGVRKTIQLVVMAEPSRMRAIHTPKETPEEDRGSGWLVAGLLNSAQQSRAPNHIAAKKANMRVILILARPAGPNFSFPRLMTNSLIARPAPRQTKKISSANKVPFRSKTVTEVLNRISRKACTLRTGRIAVTAIRQAIVEMLPNSHTRIGCI